MAQITFEATPFELPAESRLGDGVLIRLPVQASELLPSRGMSFVTGHANGVSFLSPVEPDGEGSHWFRVSQSLLAEAGIRIGEKVELEIEPTKEWPEPAVPDDLRDVLARDEEAEAIWHSLTPAARWDWIRWISYARLPETRKRHAESVPSRLRSGKRRPCCFDRSVCTLTDA